MSDAEDEDDGDMCPQQEARPGLRQVPNHGRGGSRTDEFGNNLAGRKAAAVSLAAYASSVTHTKVSDFAALWQKQAAKRSRAQEKEEAAGEVAQVVEQKTGGAEFGSKLDDPRSPVAFGEISPFSPTNVEGLKASPEQVTQDVLFGMIESLKLSLSEVMTSTLQRDIIPSLRGAIDELLRKAS